MSIQCISIRMTEADKVTGFLQRQKTWWCRSCIGSSTNVAHAVVCDVIRRLKCAVRYYAWDDAASCKGCGEVRPCIRFDDEADA